MVKVAKEERIPDHLVEDPNLSVQVRDLVIRDFPDLINAKIATLVKISEKQTIGSKPAQLKLCSARDRFYHKLDYILEIEQNIIRELDPIQLENLLFRTLAHGFMNDKAEYKIQPADFSFFKKELNKYGESGMLDIVEIINTIRDKYKKKSAESEAKDDGYEDFEA